MSDFDEKGKFAKGNSYSFANKPENINLNGRPKGRSLSDHLRKLLDDKEDGEKHANAQDGNRSSIAWRLQVLERDHGSNRWKSAEHDRHC